MASLDSCDSPRNPSFALRETHHQKRFIPRSISVKELSFSEFYPYSTPPRFSFTGPHPSTPSPYVLPTRNDSKTDHTVHLESSYRCMHSVLRKRGGQVLSMAFSNDFVYTGSDTNLLRIWKLPAFKEYGQLKTKACMVVALEVVNNRVYAAYGDGRIRVWKRTWDGGMRHVRVATMPRNGSSVLSYISGKDRTNKHTAPITSLAVNATDDILYSASLDTTVKVWRLSDFECIETIQAHTQPINAAVVSSDGMLFTGSDDATVGVWRRNFCRGERRAHALTKTLSAKQSPVKALALAPSQTPSHNGFLYAGCNDGYVHYWTTGWFLGQMQYGGALQGHTHAVMCLASVANYVISGSADSTCRVWAREEEGQHACLAVLAGHIGPIKSVAAFSRRSEEEDPDDDGCTICTGGLDGVMKVWKVTRMNHTDREALRQNGCDYFDSP